MLILNLAIAALIAYISYTIGWLNGDANGYAEAHKIIKRPTKQVDKEKANESVQDNL